MKRDVGGLLRNLIREEKQKETGPGTGPVMTSLGKYLEPSAEGLFSIDLTDIRIFRGIHAFVRLLASEVIEQCGMGVVDVMVRRRVDPKMTPELAGAGLDWVMLYARLDAAESIPFSHRHFSNCMQAVFRALQAKKWGGVLFPYFFDPADGKSGDQPPALLFPFHLREQTQDDYGHYFLVEYNPTGRFLRITIEDAGSSRLQLKHISHRVVDQAVMPSYLPDVHLTAQQIHQGIIRECMNHRSEYREIPEHQPDLFDYLRRGGLPEIQAIQFRWPTDDIQMLLLEKQDGSNIPVKSLIILMKEIQLLEDPHILSCLARGCTVEMTSDDFRVYFDISRFGACLNVSFDSPRRIPALEDYLVRMPVLHGAIGRKKDTFKGVRILLIHHITAEVLGLIKSFEKAGSSALTAFFVKYAGIVPESYLETLLSLPPETFSFFCLQKLESRDRLAGRYSFSRQFGPLSGLEEIDAAIFNESCDFLQAMRSSTGHIFLKEAVKAQKRGEKMLLVEDGGYLAPVLNRFCLEEASVDEVFIHFRMEPPAGEAGKPFAEWLDRIFLGGIEHTRNGYDADLDVQAEFSTLHFPVASIAVSNLKRGTEARECAVSILTSTEMILHRLGVLLSRRTVVLLGSCGAIGGHLKTELMHRLERGKLYGVDTASKGKETGHGRDVPALDDLGRGILRSADLFIGVVGKSILKAGHIEDILAHGTRKKLFFVSGSTKTVEFSDLENFLQSLRDQPESAVSGRPVQISWLALRDPQTGVLQGYEVNISFTGDQPENKTLYLLGELTPINFLYYGIPTEVMDEVMAQLFTVTCGLTRRQISEYKLPPELLAVDHRIDADANILPDLSI